MWLEVLPRVAVDRLVLVPDLDAETVVVTVESTHAARGETARVIITADGMPAAEAIVTVGVPTPIALRDGVRTWSPETPFLYDVQVTPGRGSGDQLSSGCAPSASGSTSAAHLGCCSTAPRTCRSGCSIRGTGPTAATPLRPTPRWSTTSSSPSASATTCFASTSRSSRCAGTTTATASGCWSGRTRSTGAATITRW